MFLHIESPYTSHLPDGYIEFFCESVNIGFNSGKIRGLAEIHCICACPIFVICDGFLERHS